MPRKKKPFIDKNKSIKFTLVHRSQQDPLIADESAPQMVLAPVQKEKIKVEEQNYGVFFDDDYNYLQHMKEVSKEEEAGTEMERFIIRADIPKPKADPILKVEDLRLPSEMFATEGEHEEVGMLNKAAPRGLDLSLDPDIVAAMDEDFDFDDPNNQIEDDFVQQLMGDGRQDGDEEDGDWETESGDEGDGWRSGASSDFGGGRSEDEFDDEIPELQPFEEEETKTKFTNYSMSSSVIRRSENLCTLDDKFEKFMDQYGELDEGALDGEDLEGFEDDSGIRMDQLLEESAEERKTRRQQILKEKEMIRKLTVVLEDKEVDEFCEVEIENKYGDGWDAESIISTYSNKYNHPKLISERKPRDIIELSSKTGIPKNTLGRGLTSAALKQLDRMNHHSDDDELDDEIQTVASRASQLSIRNKHETIEEKRARKQAVKEFRRERRIERKANSQAFKDERKRQEKNRKKSKQSGLQR